MSFERKLEGKVLEQQLPPKCTVEDIGTGDFLVRGILPNGAGDSQIVFWAASPPDMRKSFAGSGLPFPNPEIAFEHSQNKGIAYAQNGEFTFKIKYPNSFYANLGTVFVPPTVYIRICNGEEKGEIMAIRVGKPIPYRALTYPPMPMERPRNGPDFYQPQNRLTLRSQEQILRDSGYPTNGEMATDFWGGKPPQ